MLPMICTTRTKNWRKRSFSSLQYFYLLSGEAPNSSANDMTVFFIPTASMLISLITFMTSVVLVEIEVLLDWVTIVVGAPVTVEGGGSVTVVVH